MSFVAFLNLPGVDMLRNKENIPSVIAFCLTATFSTFTSLAFLIRQLTFLIRLLTFLIRPIVSMVLGVDYLALNQCPRLHVT
jgi:hypothetical protein